MSRRPWQKGKYPWLAGIMAISAGGAGAWRLFTAKADGPIYLLGSVDRGDIVIQVTATGTLAAVTTVQVGSQVSGNIAELYADYNSEVKKGELLARLDPQLFETQVQQAEANVRTSEMTLSNDLAGIAGAKANLEKARVDVAEKQRKLRRQTELYENNLVAKDDFDTTQAALEAALAASRAVEAQLQSAEAGHKADEARLQQARASLQNAMVNLEHTRIHSPISGTVISRSVDRGQTVAASKSDPLAVASGSQSDFKGQGSYPLPTGSGSLGYSGRWCLPVSATVRIADFSTPFLMIWAFRSFSELRGDSRWIPPPRPVDPWRPSRILEILSPGN